MMKHNYFECKCTSLNHVVRFSIFNWHEDQYELMISTHLANFKSFWQRLRYGLEYIFKFQHTFGGWSESYIQPEDVPRLIEVLEEFESLIEEKRELIHEDELPYMTDEEYTKWYATSYVPEGGGCRVGFMPKKFKEEK